MLTRVSEGGADIRAATRNCACTVRDRARSHATTSFRIVRRRRRCADAAPRQQRRQRVSSHSRCQQPPCALEVVPRGAHVTQLTRAGASLLTRPVANDHVAGGPAYELVADCEASEPRSAHHRESAEGELSMRPGQLADPRSRVAFYCFRRRTTAPSR